MTKLLKEDGQEYENTLVAVYDNILYIWHEGTWSETERWNDKNYYDNSMNEVTQNKHIEGVEDGS